MLVGADARRIPLKDASVQCVVTSPAYWGLRKYAGEQELIWRPAQECKGGKVEECGHGWIANPGDLRGGSGPGAKECYGGQDGKSNYARQVERGGTCVKCGAWRGAYGLEPTVDCGRPFMEMRLDLTPAQREYVHQRLLDEGLHDADFYGIGRTGSRRSVQSTAVRDAAPTTIHDVHGAARRVGRNPDMSNHPDSEQPSEIRGRRDFGNLYSEQGCGLLSIGDAEGRSGDCDVSGGSQQDGCPAVLQADERDSMNGPSGNEQSCDALRRGREGQASSVGPSSKRKSSVAQLKTSPDFDVDSARSHGKSGSKTHHPGRRSSYHTGCICESKFLAQSILSQDILKFYRVKLCSRCYVCHTVEILREVRRVLRKDGVCFWNIGDSYNASQKGSATWIENGAVKKFMTRNSTPELKPKDLCLIPMRVALAAQADGWWVRSAIIWAKPNPMPESVTDRPTDAYEYVLMLTKSARYFWDAEAVKEPAIHAGESRVTSAKGLSNAQAIAIGIEPSGNGRPGSVIRIASGRNLRNVWTFATQPYSGAHFATFPEELPRRCILAATSAKGACRFCGAPWERVTRGNAATHQENRSQVRTASAYTEGSNTHRIALLRQQAREAGGECSAETLTIGWRPGCACGGFEPRVSIGGRRQRKIEQAIARAKEEEAKSSLFQAPPFVSSAGLEPHARWLEQRQAERLASRFTGWPETRPCVVLDPFAGSGTTGRVAVELGRRAILIDLAYGHREGYGPLAKERTSEVQPALPLF